jgi:hypothetical protein
MNMDGQDNALEFVASCLSMIRFFALVAAGQGDAALSAVAPLR